MGTVTLFRRGHRSRDALRTRFLFVTNNKLLAIASRKYLIEQGHYQWIDCPPILHVGQLTTIMWLLKHKGLEDKSVTRELLANCYAAYRPDPEWFDKFIEAVNSAKQLAQAGGERALDDSIVLQAARRIAQDQSYGRAAILQKLDVAEILSRANREKEELVKRYGDLGKERGAIEAREEMRVNQLTRATGMAHTTVRLIEMIVLGVAIISALFAIAPAQELLPRGVSLAISIVGVPLAVLSVLDLFGVKLIKPAFDRLRKTVGERIFRMLQG